MILLAVTAVPLQAADVAPVPIAPGVDTAEQRQALRTFTACLANARPRWARQTLAQPYLSQSQASAAAEALSGQDNCIAGERAEVTFRTSSLVGSLAEHFVRSDIEKADPARLKDSLSTIEPLNVTEDFALCVAARNPPAARNLAVSELGSEAEMAAAHQLSGPVKECTNPGEKLTVDVQALRALVSTALYRGMTKVLAARN
nr:hypothetical protein [uncultured Sphingosinicella sp.]